MFRLGGDEFAVVVDGGGPPRPGSGERIRRGLRASPCRSPDRHRAASHDAPAEDTPDELARRRTAALYAAKKAGKNRVLVLSAGRSTRRRRARRKAAELGPPLRALIVDDDPALRELVRTVLEGAGCRGRRGDDAAARARPARRATLSTSLVLDLGSSGRGRPRALPRAEAGDGRTCRSSSSRAGRNAAEGSAVFAGADAFLHKPFGPLELIDVVERLAGRAPAGQTGARGGRRRRRAGAAARARLSQPARDRARTARCCCNARTGRRSPRSPRALESKDTSTESALEAGAALRVPARRRVDPLLVDDPSVEYGFLLHDVGKIGIPDQILLKPGPLTPSERRLMETHTLLGEQMLADVEILHGAGIRSCARTTSAGTAAATRTASRAGHPARGARLRRRRHARRDDERPALPADRNWRDAIVEIERNAGTQFDPIGRRGVRDLRALAPRDSREFAAG